MSGAELAVLNESPSEVPLSQVDDAHLFTGDRCINSLPGAVYSFTHFSISVAVQQVFITTG